MSRTAWLGVGSVVVLLTLAALLALGTRKAKTSVGLGTGPRPAALVLAEDRVVAELSGLPAFEDRLAGLPDDERRNAIDALEAKGMRRLGDEALLERAALVGEMLGSLDPDTCGAIVRGQANPAQFSKALGSLPPSAVHAWAELALQAARAELTAAPVPPDDPAALQAALVALGQRIPPLEIKRLGAALTNLRALGNPEACWAGRRIYAEVHELGSPHDRVLARVLAQR
ncbi:MAG TPA: hypothetical protein VEG67_09925 [Myxococcota bacterium]|nr:hypothetical protein [Myxococcota bacterium]